MHVGDFQFAEENEGQLCLPLCCLGPKIGSSRRVLPAGGPAPMSALASLDAIMIL